MVYSRRWLFVVCLVPLVALLGCGPKRPKTTPVSGTVTFKQQPLKGAAVWFIAKAKGRPAMGMTDENGQYRLKTFEPNDGAVPGEYAVSVAPPASKAAKPGAAKSAGAFPAKYRSSETSGLHTTVETGKQDGYNFNLE